jgi:hypothetical protein
MKRLQILGIVVGGAIAVFAIYTFGWHENNGGHRTIPTIARGRQIYTLGEGDVVRVPAAAARCEVSQEA